LKILRINILRLSRAVGWPRSEIRNLSLKEFAAYLKLLPEALKNME